MVKNTRKANGIGALRPLKQPRPLDVKTKDDGLPSSMNLRGQWVKVKAVEDRWRIDDEWWRIHPISRMYYQCVVNQGLKATIYQDLITGKWYWQKV